MSNVKNKKRPKRVGLVRRRILEAKKRPGYVRRWVNEDTGAVEAYKEAGWECVSGSEDISDSRVQNESKLGSVVRRVVNRDRDASAKTAVLMEIPEEWYEEAQKEKQLEVDKTEQAIYNNNPGDYGSVRKTYS